ncbi:MAG: hypothetical protein IKW30_07860 [Lachnospiraceae bacterium]|nr:hypothetical protein [Lachnospiraceae bacterium]
MEYNIDDNFNSEDLVSNNQENNSLSSDLNRDNNNTEFPEEEFSNYSPKTEKPFPNVFALFSKSLGVFSVFCAIFSIFFGAFICGGLAIILAVLSKGYNTKMEKNAKIGLATGIIAIVLQLGVLVFSIYNVIYVPEFREQFNSMYEQIYGVPADESIQDILDQLGIPDTEGGIL